MIKEMLKIQIIGPKTYVDEAIKVLHSAAVVHISTVPEDFTREDSYFKKLPMEKEKIRQKEELEKASERLRNLRVLLSPPQSYRAVWVGTDEISRYMGDLVPVEERAASLRARLDDLSEELSTVSKYEKLLRGFAPIVSRLGGLKNFEIAGLTIEKTREDVSRLLEIEAGKVTDGNYQMYVRDLDEHTEGIVLTYPRVYAPQVKALLSGKAISEIRLPDEYAEMTLLDALKLMGRRKAELPAEISHLESELDSVSYQWYGAIAGLSRAVEDALDEIGALSYAAQSAFTFVIEGWVPADRFEGLKGMFGSLFGEKISIRTLEISNKELESVPVCIRNPLAFRPFEVFLYALPPPKYGSIDPTPYVALFFPAFFGLIVADMGYGALMFIIAVYMRHRLKLRGMQAYRDIFTVLAVSSTSAIIFGYLFGEFFGDLGERLGFLQPVLFHRIDALKTLMLLTLGIGAGHVFLGIALSIINKLSRGRVKEAGAKLFYLITMASFIAIVGVMSGYLPKGLLYYGVIAFAASFIGLIALEGVLGPLEFIEALGNILSYIRIMAVGTASVVMALVANKMSGLSESLIVGVIAAGMMHLLNLVLSILSPSIQSMRLQYVEFFSKFYEGGGRKYTPFKKR